MATDVEICNLALAHLGEQSIAVIGEDNARAAACRLRYGFVRDEVLRSHRWNFAQARVALSVSDPEAPAFGWAKQFDLPGDCLRVLEFNGTEAGQVLGEEFIIEGRLLLTDATTAQIIYIRREEDETKLDPIYVNAFALKLAAALAESIRGTTEKSGELLAAYERVTSPLARRIDANEGKRRRGMIGMNSMLLNAREDY